MLTLILLGVLLVTFAGMWFMGLWSNTMTLCNVLISTLLASSMWEPIANTIELQDATYTYIADFVAVWAVFFVSFAVIRVLTELLSKHRVQFHAAVDFTGRTFVSFLAAWILMCFTAFTLHMAPAKEGLFDGGPTDKQMLVGPDRLWLRFMQSRSKGALSEFKGTPFIPAYDLPAHPDDGNVNCRVFDPQGDFVYKYRNRRKLWSNEPQLRVARQN